ncbi:hypothetical protein [Streptomyces sp. T028]|uniref:hypothetical protein n=1 Tax=Streptomyces sp. T028 TaxID=3394379 RepID=UPI003A8A803E
MRQGSRSGRPGARGLRRPPGVRPATCAAVAARGPSRSARGVLAVCGAALALVAASPTVAAAAGSPSRDVQLVYCLSDAHRVDLVAAAVRLGLLTAESTTESVRSVGTPRQISSQRWADVHQKDFARACSALMAATAGTPVTAAPSPAEEDWFLTFVKGLPPLLVGVLLTLGGQLFERTSSERRELKKQLQSEESAFRWAVGAYLEAYEDDAGADHTAVRGCREGLIAALGRLPGSPARRRAARLVAADIPLGEPLPRVRDGAPLGKDARSDLARAERTSLNRALASLSGLDHGRVYWGWRSVRQWLPRRPGAAV